MNLRNNTLFLQGDVQVGKSTIIQNALKPYEQKVCGLVVQRLFENNQKSGFRACIVDGKLPALEAQYAKNLSGIFLYKKQAWPQVLEQAIDETLELCVKKHCHLIVLDEIGGLELLSKSFMTALHKILQLKKPCLGVVKSLENLAHTARRVHLPETILELGIQLQQELESSGEILIVDPKTRHKTADMVQNFIKKVLCEENNNERQKGPMFR